MVLGFIAIAVCCCVKRGSCRSALSFCCVCCLSCIEGTCLACCLGRARKSRRNDSGANTGDDPSQPTLTDDEELCTDTAEVQSALEPTAEDASTLGDPLEQTVIGKCAPLDDASDLADASPTGSNSMLRVSGRHDAQEAGSVTGNNKKPPARRRVRTKSAHSTSPPRGRGNLDPGAGTSDNQADELEACMSPREDEQLMAITVEKGEAAGTNVGVLLPPAPKRPKQLRSPRSPRGQRPQRAITAGVALAARNASKRYVVLGDSGGEDEEEHNASGELPRCQLSKADVAEANSKIVTSDIGLEEYQRIGEARERDSSADYSVQTGLPAEKLLDFGKIFLRKVSNKTGYSQEAALSELTEVLEREAKRMNSDGNTCVKLKLMLSSGFAAAMIIKNNGNDTYDISSMIEDEGAATTTGDGLAGLPAAGSGLQHDAYEAGWQAQRRAFMEAVRKPPSRHGTWRKPTKTKTHASSGTARHKSADSHAAAYTEMAGGALRHGAHEMDVEGMGSPGRQGMDDDSDRRHST